ncbi:chalcone synthase [Paenibacillus abyssi]|uniref:Chalcone synthase n=2 Tax=Paenibacillus abyssi TaxID=1340531 RepID=A0A917D7G4_9BACL|nr:chalcone synthase [Paenibacillus abyssi]
MSSSIAILGIGTALPAFRIDQAETAERVADALREDPSSSRWAKKIFKQCAVESRYTCEPNLLESTPDCRYFSHTSLRGVPTTSERMKTYKRESVPLGLDAARKALLDAKADASDITHLITVSCTGQFLPGIDAALAVQLGLAADVNRIMLQFIGCAAGLKAVCLSRHLVLGNPSAKVLIVCVELCTLHMQPGGGRKALFAAALFGDGASACVVGRAGSSHNGIFKLGTDHSVLLPDSSDEMVWEVGDHGFDLYLSPNIPKLIGRFIPAEVERLIDGDDKPELWAIHPGGKGIVDILQDMFGLTDEQSRSSRCVLRNYGNMSSATILFVLNEMRRELKELGTEAANGIALAFGPGLTAELLKFTYLAPVKIPEPLLGGSACV